MKRQGQISIGKQEDILFSDYIIIQSELASDAPKEYLNLHGIEWFYDKETHSYSGEKPKSEKLSEKFPVCSKWQAKWFT